MVQSLEGCNLLSCAGSWTGSNTNHRRFPSPGQVSFGVDIRGQIKTQAELFPCAWMMHTIVLDMHHHVRVVFVHCWCHHQCMLIWVMGYSLPQWGWWRSMNNYLNHINVILKDMLTISLNHVCYKSYQKCSLEAGNHNSTITYTHSQQNVYWPQILQLVHPFLKVAHKCFVVKRFECYGDMFAMIDDLKHTITHCMYLAAKLLRNETNAMQSQAALIGKKCHSFHITAYTINT